MLNIVSENANKASASFAYIVEPIDLWHARLGHVNYISVKIMRQLNLIPYFKNCDTYKCEICVEAKFNKKLFKSVEKNSEVLELYT